MQIKHFQKYNICIIWLALLVINLINQTVYGQNDSTNLRLPRHIISIHETSDFNLSQYGYDTKHPGNYPTKYGYYNHLFRSLRGFYSYSVGLNYEYHTNRSVGINCGFYFSKQGFFISKTNIATIGDTNYPYFDYYVSYIYFPIGVKISFLNKYKIRPNLTFDLINAFLTNEKVSIFLAQHQRLIVNSGVDRYYFLKPQITVGADYYINKMFRLGIEMIWKGNAFYHTNKTFPDRFKYTNLNLGFSFGYVIK
jgi:hypothetical protein